MGWSLGKTAALCRCKISCRFHFSYQILSPLTFSLLLMQMKISNIRCLPLCVSVWISSPESLLEVVETMIFFFFDHNDDNISFFWVSVCKFLLSFQSSIDLSCVVSAGYPTMFRVLGGTNYTFCKKVIICNCGEQKCSIISFRTISFWTISFRTPFSWDFRINSVRLNNIVTL